MNEKILFRGAMTALITPFDKSGKVQEEHLKKILDLQIQGGIDAVVPCGTTGEASTLEYDEHFRVCELTTQYVNKRAKVIIGGGSNNTHRAIQLTRFAKEIGADAVLSVGPYYNKPTQEGHYHHFKAIAESANIPLIIYNIPGRTGVNIEPDTLLRLAEDLRHKGAAVFCAEPGEPAPGRLPAVAVDHPETDAVCLVQSFYAMLVRLAQRLGTDLDRPRHLEKITRTR